MKAYISYHKLALIKQYLLFFAVLFKKSLPNFTLMNYNILRRLTILILLLTTIATIGQAQDSVKTTVKKAIIKPGAIPINPKTGKPYSKYGYGSYAKTYKATHTADSLKKASALKAPATTAATTPAAITSPAPPAVDKSLRGQYKYVLTKVYNYQQPFVAALWKNFMDTLNRDRSQLKDARAKLSAQDKTISGLRTDVSNKDETLSISNSKADSISFVGIDLTKSVYNLIMWSLVIICGATAAVVIARSGSNRNEAQYRIKLYNELEEEFKTYKSKANEKEKKLARELQTERNKVDELMGR